ncbi:Transglutaminase-like superfamily protein [Neorhodopirellula lusitana]|uniref:Transglutaminase-like superfamily protein n=1 Tax=Neorhodopirellula lusitana TaxID=445327 RepID=A0ABY1Q724_9BACT|nr:transglutaminase-like domain-containing protein [Neorhodopirellula lusitana]SMP61725.1 Transglutaminase-like superfamily protein [Neorhodopirellula lusitana]
MTGLTIARRRFLASAGVFSLAFPLGLGSACADDSVIAEDSASATDTKPGQPNYVNAKQSDWRFGVSIDTPVTFTNGIATFPIPMDWPEQTVEVVTRELDSAVAQVQVREIDGGVRQVVMAIPRMTAHATMQTVVTMRIVKREIQPPQDTDSLTIPKRVSRELRSYMGNSPMIDASNGRIRALSRELASSAPEKAWDLVRAIYDRVREEVRYVEGPIRNASDALETGEGDCEDMTSLFVALCRNAGVPARMVWVPGHCYPEFYLEQDGQGYWYPCQAAGTEQFGKMQEDRPIVQKGDRFKTPEQRKPVRYVSEYFRCDRRGNGTPRIEMIRGVVTE